MLKRLVAEKSVFLLTFYSISQMKHVYPPSNKLLLPKGLLQQVDRGTVELSMHLIVLSLSLVRILLFS